ncbi:hypothetical protein C1H46_029373 [Malus baccata]|uniref:Uncharacterized protein n=1 Tax=Malus baccata TaxID=106549 RepID=A0A540LFH7_MALBA|nr:hypothetical protein C1H46_029373 [Malus baccata]
MNPADLHPHRRLNLHLPPAQKPLSLHLLMHLHQFEPSPAIDQHCRTMYQTRIEPALHHCIIAASHLCLNHNPTTTICLQPDPLCTTASSPHHQVQHLICITARVVSRFPRTCTAHPLHHPRGSYSSLTKPRSEIHSDRVRLPLKSYKPPASVSISHHTPAVCNLNPCLHLYWFCMN